MKNIVLSGGVTTLVDNEDYAYLKSHRNELMLLKEYLGNVPIIVVCCNVFRLTSLCFSVYFLHKKSKIIG